MTGIHDSHRRALRAGLPWIFVGFLLLALSIGLWLLGTWDFFPDLGVLPDVAGALGSGAFLVGLLQLARARIARRFSGWLVVAFGTWLAELALRLDSLVSTSNASATPGLRLVLVSTSILCLAGGMLWIWDGAGPRGHERTWSTTRRLFAVQLCATLSLLVAARYRAIAPEEAYRLFVDRVPLGLGMPLVWLVFAGPFAHLFLSIKRTIRGVARRVQVTELLGGESS